MAIKHTINGIEFTDIKTSNKSFQPLVNSLIGGYSTTDLDEDFSDDNGKLPTIVNAVEIDWNSAEITSTAFPSMDRTINTTGDLLSWIKEGIEEAVVSGKTSEVVRRSLWIN